MRKNMSSADRVIRIILALVVGMLYVTGQISGTAALILGLIALIFLITGFVGTCPLYSAVGISTRKEVAQ